MEVLDCVIVGAGPAGLNASLILGRARKKVALFDNGTNRNRVTQESHGFITREGIKPAEFKEIGLDEIKSYPSVQYLENTVSKITKQSNGWFKIVTMEDAEYLSEKIILATGVQEIFPSNLNIKQYYGKSLFSCPYCDGWELQDQSLIVISENEEYTTHIGKLVSNWSKDLVIATNGHELSNPTMNELSRNNITVITEPIKNLHGEDGYLKKVEFYSGHQIERFGGFIVPSYIRPNQFAEELGCEIKENGAIVTDDSGRTTQKNIYTAGETSKLGQSLLIIAASEGAKAAMAVNLDMIDERF
ncbi:NAD(P)/FAD-dependent oxidoreductase [Peribacillus aracenensis]|uniref:NAD(P)/FAD-dependent oxidoreductase n=1 Tax=Peribacillus aracenensis TaxID=2976708 RepID=UPI0021A4DCEF|nr:NAD(P)/FAD-dependent oxidoreductase [Peribacillus sp. BBB004]